MPAADVLNAALVGRPGGRAALATPALVLDLDAFERNVARMAAHCREAGIALRPHAKTHKSVTVARAQLAAGAIGICCAKLGEAEAMADGGLDNLLLTSPVVAPRVPEKPQKSPEIPGVLERLRNLHDRVSDLMVVVDHPDNVRLLASGFGGGRSVGRPLQVLIDLDVGLHRTGVAPGGARALAAQIAAASGLRFGGLQAYAGHLMHEADPALRRTRSLAAMETLRAEGAALEAAGFACPILTGGGTGTFDMDPAAGVLTDLQGGSYIFMDRQYAEVPGADGAPLPFEPALMVQMRVISVNTPGIATTDAGFKAFATDADPPVLMDGAPEGLDGAPEGTSFFFFGDEQGGLAFPDKQTALPPGAAVCAMTPHCDPTVNLYNAYHVVRGDTLVDIWPIEARGCSA